MNQHRIPPIRHAELLPRQAMSVPSKLFVGAAVVVLLYLAALGIAFGRHRHAANWAGAVKWDFALAKPERRPDAIVVRETLSVQPRTWPAPPELIRVAPRIYTVTGPSPEALEMAKGMLPETTGGKMVLPPEEAKEGAKPSREDLAPTLGPR